jgi:pyridoxal phosphate enzyme (YggS family)
MSLQERLSQIQENIRAIAGDRPVTVVAVSKYATLEQMVEAYEAGVRHFGENRVQDALRKMDAFPPSMKQDIHWHFIGSLQSNKVNKTLGRFSCIHTIDSLPLAKAVSAANAQKNLRQAVLLQVNSTQDPSRHGILPVHLKPLLEQILPLPGLQVNGLMTMAPADASLSGDAPTLEKVFCRLRDLRDRLSSDLGASLPQLSMGMSHDYVHALKCGATIIRIGNLLFKN